MEEKKPSAKQRQAEINQSRRRWMTLFKVAAGAGLLLLGGIVWPDGDRSDNETPSATHDTRRTQD